MFGLLVTFVIFEKGPNSNLTGTRPRSSTVVVRRGSGLTVLKQVLLDLYV